MRFLLLLLAIFLPFQTWANEDSGLYDPKPPAGSAFVRFVNDETDTGIEKVKVNGRSVTSTSFKQVTPYFPFRKGALNAQIGNAALKTSIKEGMFYTLVYGNDKKIRVLTDTAHNNISKASLTFYNLTDTLPLSLKTSDGKLAVASDIKPQQVSDKEVNPIKVELSVFQGSQSIRKLPPLSMEAQGNYSIFVFNEVNISVIKSETKNLP